MSLIDRKTIESDTAELLHIRQAEAHRTFTPAEMAATHHEVCKIADKAERRAKGER